jgi:hypothetical protein
MDKILFKEEQQFRQWWNLLIVIGSIASGVVFSLYALYQQVVLGKQVGNEPAPNVVLVISIIFLLFVLWLYLRLKLEVKIDYNGIHYRFFPLIVKERTISFPEIKKYEIRKYNAIRDYGGWGVKRKLRWGRAYNVSGNIGLQIYLNNGKKVLFGTQKPQAMIYAMDAAASEIQNNKKKPQNN